MADTGDTGRKTCFVAMPVSTPSSYADDLRDTDHFAHVLTYLFTPALERAGYTVIPPKMLGAALIHAEIIKHLEQADIVLADLSHNNPNVFFELGIRTSLDRPVVLVKDGRTAMIPFDLGPINVLTYDESLARWTLDEETRRLAEHVSNVPTDGGSGNAMWQYFGLTKRGGPAEAGGLEAKVDLLLSEVTKQRLAPTMSESVLNDQSLNFMRVLEATLGRDRVRVISTDPGKIALISFESLAPETKESIQRFGAQVGIDVIEVIVPSSAGVADTDRVSMLDHLAENIASGRLGRRGESGSS